MATGTTGRYTDDRRNAPHEAAGTPGREDRKKHLEPALGVFSIELPSKAYARYISTQSKVPFVHCYIL